jgi:ABC-type phosphate transport system substrate-binding protein
MELLDRRTDMARLQAGFMGTVAFACLGASSQVAQAGSVAFGVGATGPQVAYRQLMDCLYNQAQGSPGLPGPIRIAPSCPFSGGNGSGFGGMMLYAPTGSGNGKLVLRTNNKANIGTPSNSIPYTDSSFEDINSTNDYDGVQFAGSDDVVNVSDIAAWNAAGNPARFGNLIQIPALIESIAIGFNGTDGTGAALNILPAAPTVRFPDGSTATGSSGLNLSRNAFCGIVSGHITQWNNPILTALNGGTLGAGNITFVHNQDGDGTTFLLSNALATQCQFEIGPNSEADSTIVSYALPWTDHAGACPHLLAHGAGQLNWPDQFPTDQCGNAVANPGGGHFANASGSGSLVALVASTNGALGYASTSFWLPIRLGGKPTANIQSQWDLDALTGRFQPPSWQGAQYAIAETNPLFDNATRLDPLAWSLQGVMPNPVGPAAYPISGFSWLEMYQCYQNHVNGNNGFLWFRIWLDFLYGSQDAHNILHDNGLAEVPGPWATEISGLLTDPVNGPTQQGSGACTTIPGAY